jgi:hypothetical protein
MAQLDVNASQMVTAAPVVERTGVTIIGTVPVIGKQEYAPAWFYSALNWLGTSYLDAGNAEQAFGSYLYGSEVDPYAQLGSTRLFRVERIKNVYLLSIAPDPSSSAPATAAARYPASDAGLLAMYNALAASPVFAAVKYCYVPGRYGPVGYAAEALPAISSGYDPATGIRVIVEGSAVAQVVPVADFIAAHNEQVYDPDPQIVPIVTALVYDVTQNNAVNATTFTLPVYYTRDLIGGAYSVSKLAATTTVNGATVSCGQTAVFPGGPGYDGQLATALTLTGTAVASVGGQTVTTSTFTTASTVAVIPLSPDVVAGACTLTYSGGSPWAIFTSQRIAGFYRDASWASCLGVPIYDYGPSNGSFSATAVPLGAPSQVYGGSTEFLNGGPLLNVVQKLEQAQYMLSSDELVSLLDNAIATQGTADGAGLAVTTAALGFTLTSAAAATVVNQLSVPVLATVTTTPGRIIIPGPERPGPEAVAGKPIVGVIPTVGVLQSIGSGANTPSPAQLTPTTVQLPLTAVVSQAVIAATGIAGIELGTTFPAQALGAGASFAAEPAGTVLNLMASGTPALAPFSLDLATTGLTFTAGVTYTFSLAGSALSVTGSDGSSSAAVLPAGANADTTHTFVGMTGYAAGTATVPLYPLLALTIPAPGAGTNGVTQGSSYSVRMTYAKKTCTYDIIDATTQAAVSTGVSVAAPKPTDGSAPQAGACYFGSFVGGATAITVWSVPVFLTVTPGQLAGASASFNGAMTLDAQVTGLPGYELAITDSSLFVYSNINVDTGAIGSVSPANVYLASAVINSAPDDRSPQAFAPCRLLMGIIRQVQMGGSLVYAFIPEDDSVVIGGVRYIVSTVNLAAMGEDPNALPFPPSYWPDVRYWQFANRHDPYLAVRYAGKTEAERLEQARRDITVIAEETSRAQEPMQLYLDTNPDVMTVWPIYAFPYATATQSVDQGQLKLLTSTILNLLNTTFPPQQVPTAAQLGEQILLPPDMQLSNPYTAGVTASVSTDGGSPVVLNVATAPQTAGQTVTNLSPDTITPASAPGPDEIALAKGLQAARDVTQLRTEATTAPATATAQRVLPPVYGFSVCNPATGEAYIVEVVNADLVPPDQLPDPTANATYDPYYVRVVFMRTLTCYNMSIIVPSIVRDQYRYLAQPDIRYQNVVSKTDELSLGYLYQVADAAGGFDTLEFVATTRGKPAAGPAYLYTNLPYVLRGPQPEAAASFPCRRRNWNADCHLMQATRPPGTSVYLAFGGGDIVPLLLDGGVTVDKRQPAHMVEFSHAVSDKHYDSVQTFTFANAPFMVGVTTLGGVVQYTSFSISATAGAAGVQVGPTAPLSFPPDVYVVGQASTTFTAVAGIPGVQGATDTGAFANQDADGNVIAQQYQLVPYNNLVYLVRAVSNVAALAHVGGANAVSGLLIDTFVPTSAGILKLAQGARYKQSGLQYFGSTYTPTTMVDTLDQLDFTSITGETFQAPTIFVPIPELDTTAGFVVTLTDFLGQQVWTIVYPEIIAQPGATVAGIAYPDGYNLDPDGKPVLSLQKLHFVYDPLAVLYTPNDLTHKYPLQPKQQVLALTNGQVREGICWRTANPQPGRLPPANICAQQVLPAGAGMDRTNIIYSPQNRPVRTALSDGYQGMSVNSFVSVSGAVYRIEESAMQSDQTGSGFISQVSSTTNMLIGVLFDYDNDDLGTLSPYDEQASTKGVVFINGYQSAAGYTFSSPDHFDVNDILPSQVPLLDEIADILGADVAFYNIDAALPQQFWSFPYDGLTAPGLPNYIAGVPPAPADPTFSNRTRSLILSMRNPVRPTQLGLMDTYSSVVSANLHLENGVTGAIFLSKKADRDIASIGSNPQPPYVPPAGFVAPSGTVAPLYGLPSKYDFFLFSRDHYATLQGCSFELIDEGYAMCLVDDGTGTGTKVAQYSIDSDGNYYELYTYVLYSPSGGVLETSAFTLKVTLGSPANLAATPAVAETPNSVNPMDLVAQINKVSNLIYAAFGPSSPGQPAAYLPIQAVGGEVQAAAITGPPGFSGYSLNVAAASRQPVQISQIYSGSTTYQIAGSTTIVPWKSGKAVPFYGSLSHGLDKQVAVQSLQSADLMSFIPRTTVPPGPSQGVFGGNGLGSLIGTQFSRAFQGSGAIPPAVAGDPAPGTVMKADDTVFYTFNGLTNAVMDSTGKSVTAAGGQYFVDETDPANPVYGVISLPKFTLNGNTCTVNVNTTLADGVTSRYTLVMGGRSYLFDSGSQVTADRTRFTFNPLEGGIYTVTYAAADAPAGTEAPTPITLTPFSMTAGGLTTVIDVFNDPGGLQDAVLGVTGRLYSYDPVDATVTVSAGAASTTAPVQTGLTFASGSFYGYVIGLAETAGGTGGYTVNGAPMFPYSASMTGAPASYPIMTAPQMFTLGGNFYTFDRDAAGDYLSVTGNGQTIPVSPYQFSLNGTVYIINTNVQPWTVVGGGNAYPMTAGNTQFVINGVQYTVTLKAGSLNGATISGQFDIAQANVVVLEDYAYELDIPNGQIVGNGTAYPLTTSGFSYTISTANQSFTITTEANAATVTIGGVVYQINNTTVVGDGITYPILAYRTFADGTSTYQIGIDGTAGLPQPLPLSAASPPTFTDAAATYTVNASAAFDGTSYHPLTGSPAQFTAGGATYQLRTDGVSIAAGPVKTYLAATGPVEPNQAQLGPQTLYFGRPADVAAFDGTNYYAITSHTFTDTATGTTFTLSGNTAVTGGNSYEIYSNLGQGAYFEVPGGKTYFVNVAVADTGTPSGTIYQVFPVSGGSFTIPLQYTIAVSGSAATASAWTISGGPAAEPTLTAAGGVLTGGYFEDPVTNIVYTCVVNAGVTTFVDSNNTVYPFQAAGGGGTFTASVVVTTGVQLAVETAPAPAVFPVINGQFVAGTAPETTTYTVNVQVAYQNAASGPYWPMVDGRFVVPQVAPASNIAYTVRGSTVTKGYVISDDDQFSPDGNVVYTVNAVNVVKATNQQSLAGSTLTAGPATYTLNSPAGFASTQPAGLTYDSANGTVTVSYEGNQVTYTLAGTTVTDSRHPVNTFTATVAGPQVTFTDTVSGVTFSFDTGGASQVTVQYPYANDFFTDAITGTTYYVDQANSRVEAISYLPETTQYAFTAANGVTYLIDYSDVDVVFPVISGADVNAGTATVGTDIFAVQVAGVAPTTSGTAIPANQNSFEVNGNLYTITGTPSGSDYSACSVVGDALSPRPFLSASTFQLTDPSVTYTLHLDGDNLPETITAQFPVRASRDLISVNDNVYLITYNSVSTGSLLGQGQSSIPITNSAFKLTNPFDTTTAAFTFDDLNIYDAGSIVGQFSAYLMPTFFIGGSTYTLNTASLTVTDKSKRPYPLIANPTMFSIGGANYVIDTNRAPHAIVGNSNVSPLSTDVTVKGGQPVANSTFTLNGQVYAFVEDPQHNLLAITGTKLYPVAQPALTFKLDSSLVFTISTTPPAAGDYAGTVVPIGTVTAGSTGAVSSATTVLNLYAGTDESGGADFFMYKNALYTLIKSAGTYTAVQKSYTVYASAPVASQQQLAVFDLGGTTYLVTDGTTAGTATAAGINPATMWAQTAITAAESQFGVVYGFATQPVSVTRPASAGDFQFTVTGAGGTATLYNILFTAGSNANMVQVNVPDLLPTFTQAAPFSFYVGAPLALETGGYNAFTAALDISATPSQTFAGAFRTPLTSTDSSIDTLIGAQGDFTLEFWHSLTLSPLYGYHPFTYTASTAAPLVYCVDVDFDDASTIYVRINNTVMQAVTTPPVFSSRWRHVALSYSQPYTIVCQGAGYEVADGTNYDFSGDFSIAMTFAASDVSTYQGLVYKGLGSANTTPANGMSYRVGVHNGAVTLMLVDGDQAISPEFSGPAIEAGKFYQVIVVKQSTTLATGTTGGTDPYDPPFSVSNLAGAATAGGSATVSSLPASGGQISLGGVSQNQNSDGSTTELTNFLKNVNSSPPQGQSYTVTISVREVHDDGTPGVWVSQATSHDVPDQSGLTQQSSGDAHLLIGAAFDDSGTSIPFGGPGTTGNIRDLYLFNSAINPLGIRSHGNLIDLAAASSDDLSKAGIVGYWPVRYDPNGVVSNVYDQTAVATSTSAAQAFLAPLSGHELEATSLYVNGYPMTLGLAAGGDVQAQMPPYAAGSSLLSFNAGPYRLEEISIWNMARAQYQILDDMFGRLVPDNEPFLSLYLSGEFSLQSEAAPALPMKKYLDGVVFRNAVTAFDFTFTPAALDLVGSPCVGRCGPLITPNLYTPPGVALTVCDTVPALTSYSVTLNTTTGTLAGEVNEVYAYVRNNVLMLYAGKKVGDLTLTWVSQEQGDVQVLGYVEGPPPAPMANLTSKPSYAGATSVTLTAPTSVTLKYQDSHDSTTENKITLGDNFGLDFGWGGNVAPVGFGLKTKDKVWSMEFTAGDKFSYDWSTDTGTQDTASLKLDESNKYTVKMEGALAPYTGDQFMANLNTVTTPSTTPGTPGTKSAILPDPNLGGFTTSNPAAQLPKTAVTEEKFGQRMFIPAPYGQAFVASQTLDIYQQTLVQSNTVYGFVAVPNTQIPRDLNVVSFRLNSQYIRPGCLDGMLGYAYNPAALADGAQTYTTSTGQLEPLYDGNFAPGLVGHDASYMKLVEAYQIKKQIDQQAFSTLALYQPAFANQEKLLDESQSFAQQLFAVTDLTPALDFYDEYIWSARGATQEVKHTYSSTYEEVMTSGTAHTTGNTVTFNMKITAIFMTALDFSAGWDYSSKDTWKYSYTATATESFDVTASFDGIDTDTQMRYSSNNDAHFVMNFNSLFNPDNQSGVELVIGSDGLVYQVVPSVSSGAGLPTSNNLDTSFTYTQPPPSYATGNSGGQTGNLEPYDRPGKTSQFRTYAFFLQPAAQNATDFWSTVVDPTWLQNSKDPDAVTLNSAKSKPSIPWRLMYRVTYSERFLPPVSDGSTAIPQITPVMAVPVLEKAADFLYQDMTSTAGRRAHNPANDIEANVVLAAPTQSGLSAGTVPASGPGTGLPVQPNNVIPFDLAKAAATVVDWGDSSNAKLLAQLITSVLGGSTVAMSPSALPGSTLVAQVADPVNGGTLYTVYTDPNGLTVNVPVNLGVTVYQDVNGNPVQYFDGKSFHSLQADYIASPDGTLMYYVQPPSTYDQSTFSLVGDYDLFGKPGDEWRYYLVSGMSSNLTSDVSFAGEGPFLVSTGASGYTGFTIAPAQHGSSGASQVQGYVLAQGVLQYPNLNTNAETFSDVQTYKSMALLDTFPIGDPETLIAFLEAQYPNAPFTGNDEITLVFARNITSYYNVLQQSLIPQ